MRWDLAKDRVPPVLLLYGDTQDLLWEQCRHIVGLLLSERGALTDLHHFYPDTKKGTYSQEVVHKIIAETSLPPYQGDCKCLVVHEVEKLSEIGENALLKTLEEPPPSVYFFLLASRVETILPTLRSRCFSFPIGRGACSEESLLNLKLHTELLRERDFKGLYQSLNGRTFHLGLEALGEGGGSFELFRVIHEFCNTQDIQGNPLFSTIAFLFHVAEIKQL